LDRKWDSKLIVYLTSCKRFWFLAEDVILDFAVPRLNCLLTGDGVIRIGCPLGVQILSILVVRSVLHTIFFGYNLRPFFGELIQL